MSRSSLRYSVTSLRAFEAVARTGGLTSAARELGVSVSGIGFHLRALQTALGTVLVRRAGRGVALTDEGRLLARDLSAGFAALDAAVEASCKRRSAERAVDVSTLPFFATRWLIPRLAAFRRTHPDVEVRVSTTERLVDLRREGFDLAVRCGPGGWADVAAARLFPQQLTPVCSVAHLQEHGAPRTPAELAGRALIANAARPGEWKAWFEAAGAELPIPFSPVQTYDSRETVFQAITAGLGFGILDRSLLTAEIAKGELVSPFHACIATDWASYLVWPERNGRDEVAAFRSWVQAEAASCSPGD